MTADLCLTIVLGEIVNSNKRRGWRWQMWSSHCEVSKWRSCQLAHKLPHSSALYNLQLAAPISVVQARVGEVMKQILSWLESRGHSRAQQRAESRGQGRSCWADSQLTADCFWQLRSELLRTILNCQSPHSRSIFYNCVGLPCNFTLTAEMLIA